MSEIKRIDVPVPRLGPVRSCAYGAVLGIGLGGVLAGLVDANVPLAFISAVLTCTAAAAWITAGLCVNLLGQLMTLRKLLAEAGVQFRIIDLSGNVLDEQWSDHDE